MGVSSSSKKPLIRFPPHIKKEKEKVEKAKWFSTPFLIYAKAFKVTGKEFINVLKIPSLDEDLVKLFAKRGLSAKAFAYSPFWEKELLALG